MEQRARILVVTGPGKGKTTAALGVVVRSLGRGKKVLLVRFTKAAHSGELAVLSGLPGLTILSGKYGMTPPPEHPDFPAHAAAARELFERAVAEAPANDCVVMDEICGVTARGMVRESEVVEFLRSLRPDQAAVLTGRGAGLELLAVADTFSEILCLKHGYQKGIAAQEGIEL